MNVSTNLSVSGNITATGTVSSSDSSIKTAITNIDEAACMTALKAIAPRTYRRTDLVDRSIRAGFLADEVQANIPEQWTNITQPVSEDVLGLDYSRMCVVLWGACRSLLARVEAL